MHTTFHPGDLLHVTTVDIEELQRGDVVAFRRPGSADPRQQVVHRVQARTSLGLITRGDRCRTADDAVVTAKDLIGRVFAVEHDGETRPVLGGWPGHVWAVGLRLWHRIAPAAGWPYRYLRSSRLARTLWRPQLAQVRLETEAGPVVKYVHRGRTIARWWPAEDRFWCRKPYDLILPRPDGEAVP